MAYFKRRLVAIFRELHELGSFVKSLNATFVVFIAEMEGAKHIKDFQSISLVGCVYKLISKVLARHLSKMLGESDQGASAGFCGGQIDVGSVMMANEVVDDLVGNKREGALCKLDMEKAYDHVNWKFVDYMLGRLSLRISDGGDG